MSPEEANNYKATIQLTVKDFLDNRETHYRALGFCPEAKSKAINSIKRAMASAEKQDFMAHCRMVNRYTEYFVLLAPEPKESLTSLGAWKDMFNVLKTCQHRVAVQAKQEKLFS